MKHILALIAVLVLSLAAAIPASADGIIIIDPPYPVPPPDFSQWLTIRYHRVRVQIDGQVATTKVDQVFRNDATVAVEGTYIFPIPPGAVVEDFKMWVDGQVLEPEILPADEARAIYESYVRRSQDPALLEYVGRDAIRASIFPIPPNEERRIQLQYSQVLASEDDLMHYHYPLNTERFSATRLEQVSIVVEVTSPVRIGALYSPTHQDSVVITREGDREATISYEASDVYPDRDFELYVGARTESLGANLLSFKPPSVPTPEDGFFLLLLSPSLTNTATETIPRDLILILDVSGSMEGDKLEQAQAGLSYILRHLNAEDQFNVVAFSSQVRTYAPALVRASEAEKAIVWIEALEALGGTNIYMAVSEALAQVDTGSRSTVVFLTDGLPTEGIVDEDALLDTLRNEAPKDVRIFPLGVGYDVNVLLLDQLAADHRGRPTYIEPSQRIDEEVSVFFARMQSPLLTDISLDFGAVEAFDIYPIALPDLYAGTQLIVTGRYSGSGPQTLTLSGRVNERTTTFTYDVNFAAHDGKAFIPRLWAARKIGYLLTQIRIQGENAEWVQAVVDLSLRYGIITPYTSFLIEEPQDALTQEGRAQASETLQEQLAAAPTAVSGEKAVDDANLRLGLGNAEAPSAGGAYAPDPEGADAVGAARSIRYVGDRTFLCTIDVCSDTRYVPDTMTLQPVPFLSDAYYDLLAAEPELAAALAMSAETIVVGKDGLAYRFVVTDTAELPRPPLAPSELDPEPTSSPTAPARPTPAGPAGPEPTPISTRTPSAGRSMPCPAPLLLLAPIVMVAVKRRLEST